MRLPIPPPRLLEYQQFTRLTFCDYRFVTYLCHPRSVGQTSVSKLTAPETSFPSLCRRGRYRGWGIFLNSLLAPLQCAPEVELSFRKLRKNPLICLENSGLESRITRGVIIDNPNVLNWTPN